MSTTSTDERLGKQEAVITWGAAPAGSSHAKHLQPGTLEFFETALKKRNNEEIPWMFEIVPFESFRGKKVLELGCGAGFDAYTLCKHGADYTGIDITPQNIERARTHLGFFGYQPTIEQGDAENLTFGDQQFEVVFSNGVLHHTPDMPRSFREANRVLKSGGEFWVILYHKNSVFYWLTLWLFGHILNLGFRKRSFRQRIGKIEYTTQDEAVPLVNAYTCKETRALLAEAGFTTERMWVRHLLAQDMPSIPFLRRFWKYLPSKILDRIGHWFGWYVIAKARKP